jgi:hypothetical protein
MSFYSKQKIWVGDMCLLKLIYKVSMLLAMSSSVLLQAQEIQSQTGKTEMRVQSCPQEFYTLPIYPDAKLCQLFAGELPASMSYFAVSDQQTARAFYVEQLGQAEDEKILHGRIVLQYSNGQKVLVISKDGRGSQIDILIKSAG